MPEKTICGCLRSVRDVLDCIFNVSGTIPKQFVKNIKIEQKFMILDLADHKIFLNFEHIFKIPKVPDARN